MSRDESRLWLRRRGGRGIWYYRRRDGTTASTGCEASDEAGAQAVLDAHEAERALVPPRGSPSASVPVSFVLDDLLARSLADPAAAADTSVAKMLRHAARARVIWLATLLGDLRIGDLGSETFSAYRTLRQGGSRGACEAASRILRLPDGAPPSMKSVSLGTVIADLRVLRLAVRGYVRRNGLVGLPDLPVPTPTGHDRTEISRHDLARMLWAPRGRRWDVEQRRWDATAQGTRGRDGDVSRFSRMVLVAAYTASTCQCVARLRWSGDPSGTTSFVDLDASPPVLYRLGPDAASGKMSGMPVRLGRRITAHLRRWRAADARAGIDTIIHHGGKPLAYAPHITFKKTLETAGLPSTITMNDIRFSAGAHLALHLEVSTWSAALLVGTTASTYAKRYAPLRPDYQARAVAALNTRPGGRRDAGR